MKKNFVKISATIVALLTLCCCAFSLVACNEDEKPAQFSQDTRFAIDNSVTDFMGQINGGEDGESGMLNLIEDIAINMDESYFEFKKDGTLHAQIQTADGLFGNINNILNMPFVKNMLGDLDVGEMISSFDIVGGLDFYVEPMFPGFRAKLEAADLKGALELIRHSLGFNIEGLDYEDEGVKEALAYVAENMKLPSNLLDLIPSDTVLKLTLDTQYAIRYLKGADGKEYKAIYLGYAVKDNPTTEPFGVFTMTEEDGVQKLFLRLEFMDINIGLKKA